MITKLPCLHPTSLPLSFLSIFARYLLSYTSPTVLLPSSFRLHAFHLPLATSLVKARHARDRMMQSSARINSVILTLEHSAAQIRVAQTMQSSTVLLKNMQQLMSIPQLRQVCTAMSKEMMKAGLIEETVNDLMEADEDIQAEAEEEVNKVREVDPDTLSRITLLLYIPCSTHTHIYTSYLLCIMRESLPST